MKKIKGLIALLAIASAFDASAKVYIVRASGVVSTINGYENGAITPAPNGIIHVGDVARLITLFDSESAQLSPYLDADPTVNIYSLGTGYFSLSLGTYRTISSLAFDFDRSVQLWDNRVVTAGSHVDNQTFEFFNYGFQPLSEYPFDLGAGDTHESIVLHSFDNSGTARSSDLISEIYSSDKFDYNDFSYTLYNSTLGKFSIVQMRNVSIDVTSVPEPATWALFVGGFGCVGVAMRRRSGAAA